MNGGRGNTLPPLMDFKWTPARLNTINELLGEIAENIAEAVELYGEKALPTIKTYEQDIMEGRYKPADYNEYRRLVRVLSNTTPETFKPNSKGITGFDMKFAKMVERQYNKYRNNTLSNYEEQVKELRRMKRNAKTSAEREMLNEQIRTVKRASAKLQAYDAFKPTADDNEKQFRRRVLGRQGATSEAYQQLRKSLYQQNYLKALRQQNISENSKTYQRIANMKLDDFVDFMDANPDLENGFHYNLDGVMDLVGDLESALDIYYHEGLDDELYDGYDNEEEG